MSTASPRAPAGGVSSAALARFSTRAALALAILVCVPPLFDPFDVPKADALALTGFAALAALGASALARGLRAHAWPRLAALDVAVVAWCLAGALSAAFGTAPHMAWLGEVAQREGLRTTFALAGVYAAARAGHDGERASHGTLAVVVGAAVVAAVYALLQFSGRDLLSWSGGAFYPTGASHVLRPAAMLGNPTLLGALLAAALAVVGAWLAAGRGDRALLVPVAAVLAVATVATLSRGAWLAALAGLAAGTLAGALAVAPRAGATRRVLVALASALVPALAWTAVALRAPLLARAHEGLQGESSPARLEIARSALRLWREHPWCGLGPDAFGLAFPRAQTPGLWSREWIGTPVHAHSVALQVLATGGVVAALAGLAWLGVLAWTLARRWRALPADRPLTASLAAAVVALAVAGAVNPVGPAGAAVFVACSALALASPREPSTRRPTSLALGAATIAGVLVLAAAVPEWRASAAAARAHGALTVLAAAPQEARLPLARVASVAAAHATASEPNEDAWWRLAADAALARADAGHALGDSAEVSAALDDAERAARAAVALQSDRAANQQRLANALAAHARWGGEPARMRAADAVFAEAERLAPYDGLILADEARAELAMRAFDEAGATARRIVALYPRAAHGHAIAAAAWAGLGARDSALAEIARARSADWEDGSEGQRAALEALARVLAGPH